MYHTEQDNYFKWCPTEKTPNQSSDNRHYSPTVDLKNLIPVARYNSLFTAACQPTSVNTLYMFNG